MENVVVSHVDEPRIPTVSGTGAFVAIFFWLGWRSSLSLALAVCSSRRAGRRRSHY
jgi:hypothetical protein